MGERLRGKTSAAAQIDRRQERIRGGRTVSQAARPKTGGAPRHVAGSLLQQGTKYIESAAVLPVDPIADARFAEFKKTLVRHIQRRPLTGR